MRAQCPQTSEWQSCWSALEESQSFPGLVCSAFQLGLLFARWILGEVLTERAQVASEWPVCEHCGHRFRSKGFRARQLQTLIGVVS